MKKKLCAFQNFLVLAIFTIISFATPAFAQMEPNVSPVLQSNNFNLYKIMIWDVENEDWAPLDGQKFMNLMGWLYDQSTAQAADQAKETTKTTVPTVTVTEEKPTIVKCLTGWTKISIIVRKDGIFSPEYWATISEDIPRKYPCNISCEEKPFPQVFGCFKDDTLFLDGELFTIQFPDMAIDQVKSLKLEALQKWTEFQIGSGGYPEGIPPIQDLNLGLNLLPENLRRYAPLDPQRSWARFGNEIVVCPNAGPSFFLPYNGVKEKLEKNFVAFSSQSFYAMMYDVSTKMGKGFMNWVKVLFRHPTIMKILLDTTKLVPNPLKDNPEIRKEWKQWLCSSEASLQTAMATKFAETKSGTKVALEFGYASAFFFRRYIDPQSEDGPKSVALVNSKLLELFQDAKIDVFCKDGRVIEPQKVVPPAPVKN